MTEPNSNGKLNSASTNITRNDCGPRGNWGSSASLSKIKEEHRINISASNPSHSSSAVLVPTKFNNSQNANRLNYTSYSNVIISPRTGDIVSRNRYQYLGRTRRLLIGTTDGSSNQGNQKKSRRVS